MAAPPPPPPPPPPPASNQNDFSRPNNKNLLASICKGTTLKKVPDSVKNDRSDALVSVKFKGTSSNANNSGPLLPPAGPMSIAEAIAARKLAKESANSMPVSHPPQSKRGGIPLPNTVPPTCVPPPPSQNKKPSTTNDIKPVPHPPSFQQIRPSVSADIPCFKKPMHESKSSPTTFPPPPPPFQGLNSSIPPPPTKDLKPRFRPPMPLCRKPMMNEEKLQPSGMESNSIRGSFPTTVPPPVPLNNFSDVRPPRFDPPPPPPIKMPNVPSIKLDKPCLPIRTDSNLDFDSRFSFVDMKFFPEPSSLKKMRQN